MDLNRLTRDADDLIRKVVSRYNQLYVPAGTLSQLELDLMLDDLRKLYDTFKSIGHINLTLQNTTTKPEVQVQSAIFKEPERKVASEPVQSEVPSTKPEPAQEVTQPEPGIEVSEGVNSEAITEPESKIDINNEKNVEFLVEPDYETGPASGNPLQPVTEIPEKEKTAQFMPETGTTAVNPEPAPATLADKFNTGNKSLSETMAPSQVQSVMGSRLQFQPIPDLITGIGLNDKFSFISDLFAGNAVKYDEAIQRINKAVNLDEANWILQKYYSVEWEQKHETLTRMKGFVKRRFI